MAWKRTDFLRGNILIIGVRCSLQAVMLQSLTDNSLKRFPNQHQMKGPFFVPICAKIGFPTSLKRSQTLLQPTLGALTTVPGGQARLGGFPAAVYPMESLASTRWVRLEEILRGLREKFDA